MFKLLSGLIAGPAGMIGAWFTSMFGKIIGILALVALIAGAGLTVYLSWEHAIKAAEDAKYEVAKRDALLKNKNTEIKILTDMNTLSMHTAQDQAAANKQIDLQQDSIDAWLGTKKVEPGGDREASTIIKETFDRLYGKQK